MIYKKTISILIIQAFLLSNISFAIPPQSQVALPAKEVITNPENIVIPRDFGLVKARHAGNSDRLIVHIQDAHCNFEAQSNIAKILEMLVKNYDLNLISVEGADGFIDTAWFEAFPDDEVRKEVATYFMKKGEITGPEYLSITSDYKIKLFGAETRSYYIQNLNAFTSSYPSKEETEKYYTQIKTVLNRLKGLIYNKELKEMDMKMEDYESKKLKFNDYTRFLQTAAERHKINIRAYENFFKLVSTLVYENKIDFDVTNKERSALIDELSKRLAKENLEELISQSVAFKVGKISSTEFYSYLKNLALKNGVDLANRFPNLHNYIIYNSVYSKIENEKLFNEIKELETAIKEKLFQNNDQRTLEKLSRHIETLLGLVNIKLLNGDFDYYKAHKEEFSHDVFVDFIKKKTTQYGLGYDLDWSNETVSKSITKLEDFYSIAIKRDEALVDNTLAAMKKEKQKIAVLVTGGFHSEGITKLLEKQGVSYIVVCPTITTDGPNPYIQILTNQRTPFEDVLISNVDAKQGMLATYRIAAARQLSTRALAEITRLIGEVNQRGLADRVADFETDWANTHIARWIALTERFAGTRSITINKDILLEAYLAAVDNAVAKGKISAQDKKTATALAKKAFDRIYEARQTGGNFIGKIGPDGCIVTEVVGVLKGNTLTLQDKGKNQLADLSVAGKAKVDRQIFLIKDALKKADAEGMLNAEEKNIADAIVKFLELKAKEGRVFLLKKNAENIFGFADSDNILVSQALSDNPIAVFHEAGEGYFASNQAALKAITDKGLNSHTFLRGLGYKARSSARSQTDEETNLRQGQGLQDRIFGDSANNILTETIALLKGSDIPIKVKSKIPPAIAGNAAIKPLHNIRPADQTPWGGTKILPYKGLPYPPITTIGESWECSGLPELPSQVNVPGVGNVSLPTIVASHPNEILGSEIAERYDGNIPLLVKFLNSANTPDATGNLSVQCHPEGKTESWVILDAEKDAVIYMGFKVDLIDPAKKEQFEKDLQYPNVNIADKYLNAIPVKKGDIFYIPAGTVHAIGKGIFLAEIQETSNLVTYRLWDWNRKPARKLDYFNYDKDTGKVVNVNTEITRWITFEKTKEGDYRRTPKRIQSDGKNNEVRRLFYSDLFGVEEVRLAPKGTVEQQMAGKFHILTCLEGSIKINAPGGKLADVELKQGESALVPAYIESYNIISQNSTSRVLKSYIPELAGVKQRPLVSGHDLIGLVEMLKNISHNPKVGGVELASFRTNHTLADHLIDYCVIKNMDDMVYVMKAASEGRNLDLYNAIFEQAKLSIKGQKITIFRGGRGAKALTKVLKSLGARLTMLVGATDDGRSWFYAARELGATGVPDMGKSISDLMPDKTDKDKALFNFWDDLRLEYKINKAYDDKLKKKYTGNQEALDIARSMIIDAKLRAELREIISQLKGEPATVPLLSDIMPIIGSGVIEKTFSLVGGINITEAMITAKTPNEKLEKIMLIRALVDKFMAQKEVTKTAEKLIEFLKLNSISENGAKLLQCGLDSDPVKIKKLLVYLEHFLDNYRTRWNPDGTKRIHYARRFNLNKVPMRSLILVGAAWLNNSDWQKACGDITDVLLEKEDGKSLHRIVPATKNRMHLVSLLSDGTIYLSETGCNEDPRAQGADFIGMWLVRNPGSVEDFREYMKKELLGQGIEFEEVKKGGINEKTKQYNPDNWREPGSLEEEVYRTAVKIKHLDTTGHKLRMVAEKMDEYVNGINRIHNATAQVNPTAVSSLTEADIVIYGTTTLESNMGSALMVPLIKEALKQSAAFKIWFPNATIENDMPDTNVSHMLEKILIYVSGKMRHKDRADWAELGDYLAAIIGRGNEFGQLGPQDKQQYIPFDTEKVKTDVRNSRNSVMVLTTNLEERSSTEGKDKYYQPMVAFGKYSADVEVESMLALYFMKKTGFKIDLNGRLALSQGPQVIKAQTETVIYWREKQDISGFVVDDHKTAQRGEFSDKGRSYLMRPVGLTVATTEDSDGNYYFRGANDVEYLLKGDFKNSAISRALIEDMAEFEARKGFVAYVMNHGFVQIPANIPQSSRIHDTYFAENSTFVPGSTQYMPTSGHHQGYDFDIKYVTEGKGVQYLVKMDEKGNVVDAIAQYLEPGTWTFALPGYIDIVVNLGNLRFNDFGRKVDEATAKEMAAIIGFSFDTGYDYKKKEVASGAAHVFYSKNGRIVVATDRDGYFKGKEVPPIRWVKTFTPSELAATQGVAGAMVDIYRGNDIPKFFTKDFAMQVAEKFRFGGYDASAVAGIINPSIAPLAPVGAHQKADELAQNNEYNDAIAKYEEAIREYKEIAKSDLAKKDATDLSIQQCKAGIMQAEEKLANKNFDARKTAINASGLTEAQKQELIGLLENLYNTYYLPSARAPLARIGNPIAHGPQVLYNMLRIVIAENPTDFELIKKAAALALLHDMGYEKSTMKKLRKADIKTQEDMVKAREARNEHMVVGATMVEKVLGLNGFNVLDIAEITGVIRIHDNPSSKEAEVSLAKEPALPVTVKAGELIPLKNTLATYLREADRLWMMSEDGIWHDLRKDAADEKKGMGINMLWRANYVEERYREEYGLYALVEGLDLSGFKYGTFFRSDAGYALFEEYLKGRLTEAAAVLLVEQNPIKMAKSVTSASVAKEYPKLMPVMLYTLSNILLDKLKADRSVAPILEKFYREVVVQAIGLESQYAQQARELVLISGQALNIISWIERRVQGAINMRLTANPELMVKGPEKYGPSYLDIRTMPTLQSEAEGKPGIYWRGAEGIAKLGNNVLQSLKIDAARFESSKNNILLYIMDHGFVAVPQAVLAMTEAGKISTIHETSFTTDLLTGSAQYASTGPGHFQGKTLDVKYVTEGSGLQYNKVYNEKGELVKVFVQYLKPGSWAVALPGAVDSVENLGNLRFNDFSVEVLEEQLSKLNPSFDFSKIVIDEKLEGQRKKEREAEVKKVTDKINAASAKTPYVVSVKDTKTVIVKNNALAPDITWLEGIPNSVFNGLPCIGFYSQLDEPKVNNMMVAVAQNLREGNRPNVIKEVVESEEIRHAAKRASSGAVITFAAPNIRIGQHAFTWGEFAKYSKILKFLGLKPYDIGVSDNEPVSEAWLSSDDEKFPSQIDLGDGLRMSLREFLAKHAVEILGEEHVKAYGPYMGCVMKLLDARDTLSIAVHPVGGHPTLPAKPEMWKILRKGSTVYFGINQNVTPEQIKAATPVPNPDEEAIMKKLKENGDRLQKMVVDNLQRLQEPDVAAKLAREGLSLAEQQTLIAFLDKNGYLEDLLNIETYGHGDLVDVPGATIHAIRGRPKDAVNPATGESESSFVAEWSQAPAREEAEKGLDLGKAAVAGYDRDNLINKRARPNKENPVAMTDVMQDAVNRGVFPGAFNKLNPKDYRPSPVQLYAKDVSGNEAFRLFESPVVIVEEMHIAQGPGLVVQDVTPKGKPRGYPVFVEEGAVRILNEKGGEVASLEKGQGAIIPATISKSVTIQSITDKSIMQRWFAPLPEEKEAIKADEEKSREATTTTKYSPAPITPQTAKIELPVIPTSVPVEWNAENIFQYQTAPDRDELRAFLASLVLSNTADNRAVIIAHDTALDIGAVAQAGERSINRYLNGKLINVRATGQKLVDGIAEAARELESRGIPYTVVTIAGNGSVNQVGEQLKKIGKVLNIQAPNGQHIPIIGLYELALRIAYESSEDDILNCLNRIAVNPDNNQPFTMADLGNLFLNGIMRLLPKIVPIDAEAALTATKMAQKVLISL